MTTDMSLDDITMLDDDQDDAPKKIRPSYPKPSKYDPKYEIHLIEGLYESLKEKVEKEGMWNLSLANPWGSLELIMMGTMLNRHPSLCVEELKITSRYLSNHNKTVRESFDKSDLFTDYTNAMRWHSKKTFFSVDPDTHYANGESIDELEVTEENVIKVHDEMTK